MDANSDSMTIVSWLETALKVAGLHFEVCDHLTFAAPPA
jgi:hypothetical protein